jgi:hypothetical protein
MEDAKETLYENRMPPITVKVVEGTNILISQENFCNDDSEIYINPDQVDMLCIWLQEAKRIYEQKE